MVGVKFPTANATHQRKCLTAPLVSFMQPNAGRLIRKVHEVAMLINSKRDRQRDAGSAAGIPAEQRTRKAKSVSRAAGATGNAFAFCSTPPPRTSAQKLNCF